MTLSPSDERSGQSSRPTAWHERGPLLRRLCFALLLLLSLQFLIGMVTNLFVTLPSSHPGSHPANYFAGVVQGVAWALVYGGLALQLHIILGIALFVLGSVVIYLAIIARRPWWIVVAVLGWIGIVAAGFNGASFLNYGFDVSSFVMSVGLFLALVAYLVGFYMS